LNRPQSRYEIVHKYLEQVIFRYKDPSGIMTYSRNSIVRRPRKCVLTIVFQTWGHFEPLAALLTFALDEELPFFSRVFCNSW
jgi:hypothetical protein